MGTSTKKATTSLSKIDAAYEKVANKANNVGNTAEPKKIRESNIGRQSDSTFWRIVSIETPKTCSDGVPKIKVTLRDSNEFRQKPFSAFYYVTIESLASLKVSDYYLEDGESSANARKGTHMSFEKFAEKYLDQGEIAKNWYVYDLVGYNWIETEKPTEDYSEFVLTHDNGELIDGHIVYIKKGFAKSRDWVI